MRCIVYLRLEGKKDGYIQCGDTFIASSHIDLGHSLEFHLADQCVVGVVDMIRHTGYALASETYGGTFQLSDAENALPVAVYVTVATEYSQSYQHIMRHVLSKLYPLAGDVVYQCVCCDHMVVRRSDGLYPAHLLTHCGKVMKEVRD